MKYLYKYPQRAFPYRDLVETNREPVARGARVRAARHRRLRRRPLLRRVRRVRQGRSGRRADPHHRRTIAGRRRRALHVLPTLWFRNTWSWGGRRSQAVAARKRRPGVSSRPRTPSWASTGSTATATPGAAVHREREQRAAALGPAQRLALRQGRVPRLRRRGARAGRSIPRRTGTKAAAPLRPRGAGRRQQAVRLRLAAARTGGRRSAVSTDLR